MKTISMWSSFRKGPELEYEFLARTLVAEEYHDNAVVLATPLYVALADA